MGSNAHAMTDAYRHPLIERVIGQGAGGEALFWEDLARLGTPLVEPIAGEDASWVTFVCRRYKGAGHMAISGLETIPAQSKLERVEGTEICYRSWRLKNDRRISYTFVPDLPLIDLNTASEAERAAFREHLRQRPPAADSLCREKIGYSAGAGKREFMSVLSLPEAPAQPWCDKRAGIERGNLQTYTIASALLGNERRAYVYTPPGYDAAGTDRYPYMLIFDGGAYLSRIPTHRILDNLIADGIIAPMIAVLIDPATDRPEARIEELMLADDYIEFLATELQDWIGERCRVATDPARNIVAGSSAGGVASAYLAFTHPELFGNVLSQSGAFWTGRDVDKSRTRDGAAEREWLVDQYEQAPRLSVDFYMDVGQYETADMMVAPNRRLRDILERKGYSVTYGEFAGGHDYSCWRGTLVDGIRALAGRQP